MQVQDVNPSEGEGHLIRALGLRAMCAAWLGHQPCRRQLCIVLLVDEPLRHYRRQHLFSLRFTPLEYT